MSVFHLKYRPKSFKDLDLRSVSDQLIRIFSQKEIPQSFLFAGPKGSGKTSAARIVATVLNCTNKKGVEACGQCDNCQELASGRSIDMAEIDAASNRGIEDVRQIKERAYLAPSKVLSKVFIIDEVHMLTKEAFNALLKILEEPPKSTYFIMCTTDPGKIPETVLSRLLRVDFAKGNKEELLGALNKIIDGEKIEISQKSVEWLVTKSDGSFRNIVKLLNELVLQFGKKIEEKNIKSFFEGRVGDYEVDQLEKDLAEGKIKEILNKIEAMSEAGVDLVAYRKSAVDFFQKRLVALYGGEMSVLGKEGIIRILSLLIEAGKMEKEVEIAQLPLQMAMVKFGGKEKKERVPPRRDDMREVKVKDEVREDEKQEVKIAMGDIEEKWDQLLTAVKPFNHSVEAFLRAARIKEVGEDQVVFEVFYPFHKEKLEEAKNRQIVERGLSQVFSKNLAFVCTLSKRRGPPVVIKNDQKMEKMEKVVSDDDLYDVAKEIFG